MTVSELTMLDNLLHSADTVSLGVEIICNLEVITPQVVALTEQALFDWTAYLVTRGLYNRLQGSTDVKKVIHTIDCIVRKPFTANKAIPQPDRCQL